MDLTMNKCFKQFPKVDNKQTWKELRQKRSPPSFRARLLLPSSSLSLRYYAGWRSSCGGGGGGRGRGGRRSRSNGASFCCRCWCCWGGAGRFSWCWSGFITCSWINGDNDIVNSNGVCVWRVSWSFGISVTFLQNSIVCSCWINSSVDWEEAEIFWNWWDGVLTFCQMSCEFTSSKSD